MRLLYGIGGGRMTFPFSQYDSCPILKNEIGMLMMITFFEFFVGFLI